MYDQHGQCQLCTDNCNNYLQGLVHNQFMLSRHGYGSLGPQYVWWDHIFKVNCSTVTMTSGRYLSNSETVTRGLTTFHNTAQQVLLERLAPRTQQFLHQSKFSLRCETDKTTSIICPTSHPYRHIALGLLTKLETSSQLAILGGNVNRLFMIN